jgi:hypothetical protein
MGENGAAIGAETHVARILQSFTYTELTNCTILAVKPYFYSTWQDHEKLYQVGNIQHFHCLRKAE